MDEYTKMHIVNDYMLGKNYFCRECAHIGKDWGTEPCKSCEVKKPTKFEAGD